MTLQECYINMGGNYEEVAGRLPNEQMIQKFVLKFLTDTSYDVLCRSMDAGDYTEAFRAAHTLKGLCQSLGFTKLFESSNRLNTALRFDNHEEANHLMKEIAEDYQLVISAIQAFQKEAGQ